ncbi:MAG: PIG-L family deacetylase [Ignavibacteria bacterium]|nr:PIG-L family deacetylase [Ignavibacteria bacterium]
MKKRTIIAFGAHPDDLEFGCAATLINYTKAGYEVIYVIATGGENGFKVKSLSGSERVVIRKNEQKEAAEKAGVNKVIFLGFKDGFLQNDDTLREKITLLIKEYKPEIIFSFDPANLDFDNINLQHRDHRNLAIAVFDSVFAAKNDFIFPDKNGIHRVEKIYFFGTNKPNTEVDISGNMDLKLSMLKCYKSQFPNFANFEKFFRDNIAVKNSEGKYMETFRVMDVVQISH